MEYVLVVDVGVVTVGVGVIVDVMFLRPFRKDLAIIIFGSMCRLIPEGWSYASLWTIAQSMSVYNYADVHG